MKWLVLPVLLVLGLSLITIVPVEATDISITAKPPSTIPTVEASNATAISPNSAVLHGNVVSTGGQNITTIGFDWGFASGNYTYSWNTTGTYGAGTFEHEISSLPLHTQVFWRAFAINDVGQGNSTELNFWTLGLPLAPTDFTITQVGDTIVSISWTMGVGANTTVIRGSSTGYPSSVTDGYPVYSGNEMSVTIDGLNLQTATYYYEAWSLNDYGYSLDSARGYAGNAISILSIVFVVGLCGCAMWKKQWIRVILSLCIIMWGAFAMPYDIKIAAPLLAIGVILFIIGIMNIIHRGEKWSSVIPLVYRR